MELAEKHEAIEQVRLIKARYFRGVDFKDEALLASIFADDVFIDYRGAATDPISGYNISPEATNEPLEGGAHAARVVANSMPGIVSVHHASVPEIEVTGPTTASAIWPMVDRLKFPVGAPFAEIIGYGHYHETYEKIDGSWKLKTMRLTRTRLDTIAW